LIIALVQLYRAYLREEARLRDEGGDVRGAGSEAGIRMTATRVMCVLTLAPTGHHADAVDELDAEGILAFPERVLPRASDLWVQASIGQKQRLQPLFFPDGVAFEIALMEPLQPHRSSTTWRV
jgi:hypothetical protein